MDVTFDMYAVRAGVNSSSAYGDENYSNWLEILTQTGKKVKCIAADKVV